MATFDYRVRDKFGKSVSGEIEAESPGLAGSKLKEMGFTPVSIKKKEQAKRLRRFLLIFQRLKFSELHMFTTQLATLQKAGLPLLTSLEALREHAASAVLKRALGGVIKDIESGSRFSDALARHPNIFNGLYISMIKAGEAGGMLDEVLERLAVLGEREEDTRNKISAAVRYPLIVIAALVAGFLILTTFVMPKFAAIFSQSEALLPLPTRILILVNVVIRGYWWLISLAMAAGVFAFKRFIGTGFGRLWWDGLKLKVPVFGPLFTKITMSRFTRITGTLIKSGIPILQILDIVSRTVGNAVIARTIRVIEDSVNEGKGISEPMRISGMFPPIVVQMVAAGEASGKIDELLLHVSNYYDAQSDYTIKHLTALIEPILIVIMGGGVLFMALGVFLPMWNIMSVFRR